MGTESSFPLKSFFFLFCSFFGFFPSSFFCFERIFFFLVSLFFVELLLRRHQDASLSCRSNLKRSILFGLNVGAGWLAGSRTPYSIHYVFMFCSTIYSLLISTLICRWYLHHKLRSMWHPACRKAQGRKMELFFAVCCCCSCSAAKTKN